jgi:Flp pilus assembly pilin Flp
MSTLVKTMDQIRNWNSERGQALAEYALILALVALACVVALGIIATGISTFFTDFAAQAFGGGS